MTASPWLDAPPVVAVLPEQPASSWRPVDLATVLDGDYRPPRAEVGTRQDNVGVFYAGMLNTVMGEPASAKSMFVQHIAADAMLSGAHVGYLDFEDTAAGVVERLRGFGLDTPTIVDLFHYVRPGERLTEPVRHALAAWLPATELVVVDGVTEAMAMHGLDPKGDIDVAKFYALLGRWIADLGPAVVFIDHVVKDSESRGRWATGSQHKLAGIDGAAYSVDRVQPFGRGLTGRSRLYLSKDRHGSIQAHALPSSRDRYWFADFVVDSRDTGAMYGRLETPTDQPEDFLPTRLMTKVSDALLRAPGPLNGREIEDRVPGRAQNVRQAIAALIDGGYIHVETGPRGARLHHLDRSYSPDEELSQ